MSLNLLSRTLVNQGKFVLVVLLRIMLNTQMKPWLKGPLVLTPAIEPLGGKVEGVVFKVSLKKARCPTCDLGMVALGIRHNADCRGKYAELRRSYTLSDLRE